ncbi:RluA family pseudouridine synthase [Candidatus Saccharibacteria bacterium]|nr:RluA family pseudouridine synthase [Candidatus Saccharibacteria bacterium]MBR3144049.1 RluA family pseudouridine synthase [Candidatus Saccharibacteria bacterium]
MLVTGKKFSKPELSRIINGDKRLAEEVEAIPKTRLDILLVNKYKSYNRSTLQKFIQNGFVTVDGVVAKKPNQKFEEGVKLELNVPEDLKNADLKPEVIYEDENVIVLDKPAGLLSMAKGEYCPEKTLEDYGLLVHRLDRDTSGVVILAKNLEVQKFLRKQFQDRKTHKTYYAVVTGRPKLDAARVDLPIARDLKRPTTFRVDPNGKASETYYRVVKSDDKHSLLELKPTTGRTHQLRVHMKYLGHPIIGDVVYGDEKADRLFLHAKSLEITLPGGERRVFEAPLPREFTDVF